MVVEIVNKLDGNEYVRVNVSKDFKEYFKENYMKPTFEYDRHEIRYSKERQYVPLQFRYRYKNTKWEENINTRKTMNDCYICGSITHLAGEWSEKHMK
ncbi:hypothetical protein CEXT_334591 [Caerostris extrusa]|uniref:Uncharacterized protein n=1 Tax=Caerostris extrusa TaxID=172846 RepID=A0AAV4T0E0_CAEEX|nr:hypothetical protein CEXT_334591 [Caerostris extrusa]